MSKTEDTHIWVKQFGLTCCKRCGYVKRADGKNKPCPGRVSVELRRLSDLVSTTPHPQGPNPMTKTEEAPSPYGYCPHCKAKGVNRERRPNGNDTCENGHVYPSSASLDTHTPEGQEMWGLENNLGGLISAYSMETYANTKAEEFSEHTAQFGPFKVVPVIVTKKED